MNGGIIGKSTIYRRPPIGVFGINDLIVRPDLRFRLFHDPTTTTGMSQLEGSFAAVDSPVLFGTKSITFSKTQTVQTWAILQAWWSGAAVDMTNRRLMLYAYFTATALSTIVNFEFWAGQSTSNRIAFVWPKAALLEGWNLLKMDTAAPTASDGTPNIQATTWLAPCFIVPSNGTTLAQNNIYVDALFWR